MIPDNFKKKLPTSPYLTEDDQKVDKLFEGKDETLFKMIELAREQCQVKKDQGTSSKYIEDILTRQIIRTSQECRKVYEFLNQLHFKIHEANQINQLNQNSLLKQLLSEIELVMEQKDEQIRLNKHNTNLSTIPHTYQRYLYSYGTAFNNKIERVKKGQDIPSFSSQIQTHYPASEESLKKLVDTLLFMLFLQEVQDEKQTDVIRQYQHKVNLLNNDLANQQQKYKLLQKQKEQQKLQYLQNQQNLKIKITKNKSAQLELKKQKKSTRVIQSMYDKLKQDNQTLIIIIERLENKLAANGDIIRLTDKVQCLESELSILRKREEELMCKINQVNRESKYPDMKAFKKSQILFEPIQLGALVLKESEEKSSNTFQRNKELTQKLRGKLDSFFDKMSVQFSTLKTTKVETVKDKDQNQKIQIMGSPSPKFQDSKPVPKYH